MNNGVQEICNTYDKCPPTTIKEHDNEIAPHEKSKKQERRETKALRDQLECYDFVSTLSMQNISHY